MKILWIDLNSSYAHASLALPAIHAQIVDNSLAEWEVVSATINENVGMIVDEIYRKSPIFWPLQLGCSTTNNCCTSPHA